MKRITTHYNRLTIHRELNTVTGDVIILGNALLKKLEFPSLRNITGGGLIDGEFDE